MLNKKTYSPLIVIALSSLALYLAVGLVVRIVLCCFLPEGASITAGELAKAIALGVVNDLAMGAVLLSPLLLVGLGLNEWKYRRPVALSILALLALAVCYAFYPHSLFHQYGGVVPLIAQILLIYKLLSFAIRFFVPRMRMPWRKISLWLLWALYVFIFLFNGVGEFFFWDEFGVRYNFIAVDYLVYTNEVVGNILESYSIVPFMLAIVVLTVAFIALCYRRWPWRLSDIYDGIRHFLARYALAIVAVAVSLLYLGHVSPRLEGNNLCANQLQQNGAYDFFTAFSSSTLDYNQFYALIPETQCRERYRQLCRMDSRGLNTYASDTAMTRCNIVLITVESLSSSFMTAYGSDEDLTPTLDALIPRSLVFDNMYAVGNRTVRGLEALSLCIPPCAGESVVKRKRNSADGRSVGDLFAREGYKTRFIYGGDSYFDNMGDYFSHNGYEVTDRKNFLKSEISFANIWGVCDEDLYSKALKVFDDDATAGRPFFAQLMTVSNHRPFTYPDGKVKVGDDPQTRAGAVKYSDYAIGQFLRQAASKPWFDNTVFVIVADHQASSAGKTSIPVNRYHIPCIVYAPKLIEPRRVDVLCSQIDIVPTLLALLNYSGTTTFAGQDVLSPDYRPRAMMATYQDLGYIEDNVLTVLSPVRKVVQYKVDYDGVDYQTGKLMTTINKTAQLNAQAYYQWANLYYMK